MGKNGVFRKFFETGNVPSFILWGPPGVGKTTLAKIVATQLDRPFFTLSAVTSGVKDVREVLGRSTLDAALNARGPLSAAASTALQAALEAYRTGLVVTELSLQDARPPEEVKPAFDEVNSAQQMNERLVNEARAYAARIVPEARGQAQRVRTVAEGYKTAAIAKATGDATRFSLLLDEYRNAPEVTRKRLWLDTVQQVLADNRKVVGGDSRQLIYVPMGGAQAPAAPAPAGALPAEVVMPQVESTPSGARSSVRTPRREEAQP